MPLPGVVPFPPEFARRYREKGYWQDKSLAEEFRVCFERFSERIFLVDGERHYTYRQLDHASDNLALNPTSSLRERPQVEEDSDDRRYAITTLHPTTYNEARTIGEHFRDGVPVIMNLTEMDESDAKRLVDFAAGLVFGLRGNFERVTNRVFLLSPANVQVTAEDKAKIAEGGFFNQS